MFHTTWVGGTGKGFTLVELLVVITIIIVLLSLLVPALDRAVYQSELAVCAARLDAIGSGVTVYAFNNRRSYPYREAVFDPNAEMLVARNLTSPASQGSTGPAMEHDDRPLYRSFIPINKALLCPASGKVDLESSSAFDTRVVASYPLWFGWRFATTTYAVDTEANGSKVQQANGMTTYAGMMKVGQRLTWNGRRYNTLAGDQLGVDIAFTTGIDSSHPDSLGRLPLRAVQDGEANALDKLMWRPDGKVTATQYGGSVFDQPGRFELNFVFDDGSVARYSNIPWGLKPANSKDRIPAMDRVPLFREGSDPPANDQRVYTAIPRGG